MSPSFPDTPHVYSPRNRADQRPQQVGSYSRSRRRPGQAQGGRQDGMAGAHVENAARCARRGAKANDPDLRAPVGQQFTPKLNGPQPWLGELKQTGSVLGTKVGEGAAQYRLYFGDIEDQAEQPAAQMLAADLLREKWIAGSDAENPQPPRPRHGDIHATDHPLVPKAQSGVPPSCGMTTFGRVLT